MESEGQGSRLFRVYNPFIRNLSFSLRELEWYQKCSEQRSDRT